MSRAKQHHATESAGKQAAHQEVFHRFEVRKRIIGEVRTMRERTSRAGLLSAFQLGHRQRSANVFGNKMYGVTRFDLLQHVHRRRFEHHRHARHAEILSGPCLIVILPLAASTF